MLLYLVGAVALLLLYGRLRERRRVSHRDKHVYVTGCDSGFGNRLARHLDELGYGVVAGCFTEKGEEELNKATSSRLTTLHLDVTDPASVAKAADQVEGLVGHKGLWALVNNAGVAVPAAPTDWLNIEDYRAMLAVNLDGVISVTLSVLPLVKKAQGRVVNVASVFGRISPFGGPYCISKYGVEAFNDSLRINMAPFGVKVCCLEPGFFRTNVTDTDLIQASLKKLWDRLPQDVKDDYGLDYYDKMVAEMKFRFPQLTDSDLMKVVDCMEHAISAVHPRKRYSPGYDAKLLWLPLSYMPTWLTDWWFLKNSVKLKIQSAQ